MSAARVAGKVVKAVKKATAARKPRAKKSATTPFRAAHTSVEPQTMNSSSLRLSLGRPAKGMKSLGRWIYTQQNNGRVTAGQGQQAAAAILAHNTVSQLMVDTSVPNALQFKDDVFSMNPYQQVIAGALYTGTQTPSQDKIYCRTVTADFQMANMGNTPCTVSLYWVLSKKSHANNPFDRWNVYLADTALGQPNTTQPIQSDSATGPGTTGVPNFAVFGQEPTTVSSWNKTFKLLRKRDYILGFGAVQRVAYTVSVNKMFDRTVAQQQNSLGSTAYPGGSLWLCIVVRGTPIDISKKEDGVDTASVSTSPNEIAWTASVSYTYTGTPATRLDVNRVTQGFPALSGALVEGTIMGPDGTAIDVENT